MVAKNGGYPTCRSGGDAESIVVMFKRRILVLAALGNSIDLNTHCSALDSNMEMYFHKEAMKQMGHGRRGILTCGG